MKVLAIFFRRGSQGSQRVRVIFSPRITVERNPYISDYGIVEENSEDPVPSYVYF